MGKSIKNKLEKFFNMPFENIINNLHIKNKISLNELSKRSGVSRQSINNCAKKENLATRSIQEATKLTKNKKENHYAFGKRKESSAWAKAHSDRMKGKNPMHNKNAAEKRAVTISETFKDKLQPQEIVFKDILDSFNINFEMQKPLGKYNLDFFIPKLNLAIEIDSTDKWGGDRYKKAKIRDNYILTKHKIKTLRINKKYLYDKSKISNILKQNKII